MTIGNITLSFPALGVYRFYLTGAPWDYVDLDRPRAALMLRWLRAGGGVVDGAKNVFRR